MQFRSCVLILAIGAPCIIAINFLDGSSGDGAKWQFNCDWSGNDLERVALPKREECGWQCRNRDDCTHFTWTNFEGGSCWLKGSKVCPEAAAKLDEDSVCGYLPDRNSDCSGGSGQSGSSSAGDWIQNIKGTRWADESDPGGCQMPEGDYFTTHALALGQQEALGPLKWRQGLCGKVFTISCSSGVAFDAVVASTCDLGSDNCGIDMITKTWEKATRYLPPGITSCSVKLSEKNPLNGQAPVCYYRPTSETNNLYFAALGLLNTGLRIVKSATIAGISGERGNDNYFLFNSHGQPVFSKDSSITFEFEDGSNPVSLRLSECKTSGKVQIFK